MGYSKNKTLKMIRLASEQHSLSGIERVLETLSQFASAYGCILWAIRPTDTEAPLASSSLFAVAQWFPKLERCFLDRLPCDESVAGVALNSKKPVFEEDIWKNSDAYTKDPFLKKNKITSILAIPLDLHDDAPGVITIYYQTHGANPPVRGIAPLARLVPHLVQMIRDKVGQELLLDVHELLQPPQTSSEAVVIDFQADIAPILSTVCRRLSDVFLCLETSIFLDIQGTGSGQYDLASTSWEWPEVFEKTQYTAGEKNITGTVLTVGQPVQIFNLLTLEEDRTSIPPVFQDVVWSDALDIKAAVRRDLELSQDSMLPPISFIAAPILLGDRIFGAIRCCAPTRGPHYFTKRALSILELVASQLASYWSYLSGINETLVETQSWRFVVDSFGAMNRSVQEELLDVAHRSNNILTAPLQVIRETLGSATGVRVLWEEDVRAALELQLQISDEESLPIEESELEDYLALRSRIETDQGRTCILENDQVLVCHTHPDMPDHKSRLERFEMIVAPVRVRDHIYGVIEIDRGNELHIPAHSALLVRLAGLQMGLYRFLADTVNQLRQAQTEVELSAAQQRNAFEDLKHQIMSPLTQMMTWLLITMEFLDAETDADLATALRAIRGLSTKALRVAKNLHLFVALAKGELPVTSKRAINHDDLRKLLVEAAMDNEAGADPNSSIRVQVHRKSLDRTSLHKYQLDVDLIDQAVNTLLDNAVKYSLEKTAVRVSVGKTRDDHLYISVENKGILLNSRDANLCRARGWRSSEAQACTDGGSGIGLWIVDHIMKAHDGRLIIVPTNKDGVTIFRIVIPPEEAR